MKDSILKSLFKLTLVLMTTYSMSSCDKQAAPKASSQALETSKAKQTINASQDLHHLFLDAARQSFEQLLNRAMVLSETVTHFTRQPTQKNLVSAQLAWKQTHDRYITTQLFRHIDLTHPQLDLSQSSPKVIHPIDIRLDQHPMIPGYLDAVAGYANSGLIYSELPISAEILNTEHQFSDTGYVAIGFHALKFMLDGDPAFDSPHSSRFASLTENKQNSSAPPRPEERRSRYLLLLVDMIIEDLKRLLLAWSSEDGFYTQTLLAMDQKQSERLILNALNLESASLSALKTESAAKANKASHLNRDSIASRTALLLSVLQQLSGTGYPVPDSLRAIIAQEEPEQTKP